MYISILRIIATVCLFYFTNALMGSMVGARILFRLDDNFEQNSKIIFTYRSVFDKSDGLTEVDGIVFKLLDYPEGPSLDYANKFGVLKITSLDTYVTTYPNKFTVLFMDGDMIEGEMEVAYTLPEGSVLENDLCFLSCVTSQSIACIAQVQHLPLL
jgi:hypothetical protein